MARKIAVIDDDEVFQLIIRKQLEMKGLECEILKFYNGQEAFDFFSGVDDMSELPDLVLLDVNMPVKDGWGFLEQFKDLSTELKSKVNLYMVTSSVIQSDIDRATKHGDVKEFVSKPITNDKLEEIFLATSSV